MEDQIIQPRIMYFKFLESRVAYLLKDYSSNEQGGLVDNLEVLGYSVCGVDEMTLNSQGPYYRLQIKQGDEVCALLSNAPFESCTEAVTVPDGSTLYSRANSQEV